MDNISNQADSIQIPYQTSTRTDIVWRIKPPQKTADPSVQTIAFSQTYFDGDNYKSTHKAGSIPCFLFKAIKVRELESERVPSFAFAKRIVWIPLLSSQCFGL